MATLSPRAPIAQATDAAAAAPASPGRSPLLALFACTLLSAGLFVGLAVAAITGFAASTGTASAALLLACGTAGALAAGLSAVAVRALRIRRSMLSAVAIGSAGGIGFAFGWLLRLTVPGGVSFTVGSTPEPLLATIESNLVYARLELVTPALSGVWAAELLLTLSAIAAAVRWVDSRSV